MNDEDVDLEALTLHIVEGKGGQYGLAYISQQCGELLRSYLEMRPLLEIDGKFPLFFTDYKNRWNRFDLSRMFHRYKKAAGIDKLGGAHVFARNSPASLMIKNGCDLLTIQRTLRHKSIESTMRYTHLLDDVQRVKYDRFLRL